MLVNSGLVKVLRILAGLDAQEPILSHLFINFPTITPASVLADFTEAAWSGYAPAVTNLGAWADPFFDSAGNAVMMANPPALFFNTSGGPQAASGFFVTGQVSGILYGAQLFMPGFLIEDGAVASTFPTFEANTF